MTAVETKPITSSEGQEPLKLTPEQAKAVQTGFQRTTHYIYASEAIQKEFNNLSPAEVSAWVNAWPGGKTELGESLLRMRERLEEPSPTSG